jgi:hypothetical protein
MRSFSWKVISQNVQVRLHQWAMWISISAPPVLWGPGARRGLGVFGTRCGWAGCPWTGAGWRPTDTPPAQSPAIPPPRASLLSVGTRVRRISETMWILMHALTFASLLRKLKSIRPLIWYSNQRRCVLLLQIHYITNDHDFKYIT